MFTLTLHKKEIHFATPVVMGILNATPDSFYTDSRMQNTDKALFVAEKMIKDGATFIDVGGQSTRPGSERIGEEEELKRVMPIVEAIHKNFEDTFISIDTFYSKVAKETIQAGGALVNDVSGGMIDEKMFETVAKLNVPYVCMHIKGTPQTMKSEIMDGNIIAEVRDYFTAKISEAISMGIKDVILDIGFGFAKTIEQNFKLIKYLDEFEIFKKPLLIGVSRKSSIYKTLGITANKALNGTTVLHTIALQKGVAILRVHDVKEAIEAIKLYKKIKEV